MTRWQQSEQRRINTYHRRQMKETRQPTPRRGVRGWEWAVPVMLMGVMFWAWWPRITVMLARGWTSS